MTRVVVPAGELARVTALNEARIVVISGRGSYAAGADAELCDAVGLEDGDVVLARNTHNELTFFAGRGERLEVAVGDPSEPSC